MLRLLVALCMCLPIGCALAQQLNVNYRTTVDSTERVHYVTFTDGKLSRRIGQKNTDQYSLNILMGKAAFDKYGVVGMNGVIEILTKN